MYRLYAWLGKTAYWAGLPLLRIILRRTNRAYVLLVSDGSVLMVKNLLGDGRWALPGGGMHANESPRDAIVRECAEELGFSPEAGTLKPVTAGTWKTHRLGFAFYIYCAGTEPIVPKVGGIEITEARWVKFSELTNRTTSAEILEAIGNATL